ADFPHPAVRQVHLRPTAWVASDYWVESICTTPPTADNQGLKSWFITRSRPDGQLKATISNAPPAATEGRQSNSHSSKPGWSAGPTRRSPVALAILIEGTLPARITATRGRARVATNCCSIRRPIPRQRAQGATVQDSSQPCVH